MDVIKLNNNVMLNLFQHLKVCKIPKQVRHDNFFKVLFSGLILIVSSVSPAFASALPQDLKNYLLHQKTVPSIRPDGVPVYNKEIMYLPVFPAYPENVKEIKIVKTYPAGKTIADMPDVILFNNNFALLKVLKTEDKLTVRHLDEYPAEIKTGTLPQDLMVPSGLVLPENLAGIIGDVYIPLENSAKSLFITGRKKAPLPASKKLAGTKQLNTPEKLKNKLFYVNDFRNEYLKVFSSSIPEPLYSLKMSGVMKDIKPVMKGKYLLAAQRGAKNIDVIDTEAGCIKKHIDLPAEPSEIAVDEKNEKVYISSTIDEMLFIIDLKKMRVTEKIRLAGAPKRIAISPDGNKIAYTDVKTSNIYILELDNDYSNKLITNYPNTSKIILDDSVLYLIARTSPKFRIVNFNLFADNVKALTKKDLQMQTVNQQEAKKEADRNTASDLMTGMSFSDDDDLKGLKIYASSIKDIEIGLKPADMYKNGSNIFILCAGNNTVYKYDINSGVLSADKLPMDGFANTFNPVPNSNIAVITNASEYKYAAYDMEKAKTVQVIPINDFVKTMTVLERKK